MAQDTDEREPPENGEDEGMPTGKTYASLDPQEVFREARTMLKFYLGLDLSLIELVRLRMYAREVLDDVGKVEHRRNLFKPADEAAVRFLVQEYDVPSTEAEILDAIPGGYRPSGAKMLRYVQEKMHNRYGFSG